MVQTQVTAQGCLGSTPEGRRPQIRGWRAGGSLAVSSPTPATPLLSPAKIRELNHAACRAARFPRVNEHTPAHRRSAWATRGLASHTELPKSLRTIPTYIVYDNVTQCFGHELLSGAMRLFGQTDLRPCRKQSPRHGGAAAPVRSGDKIHFLSYLVCIMTR